MTAPRLTFWFEFASTYSYLSAMRIADRAAQAGVDVVWQPFLLGPIFHAQGWETSPFNLFPAKGRYMWRDMDRSAAQYGLPPLVRPDPFPQNGLLAARIALLIQQQDWGPGFVRGVFAAQFAKGLDISKPETLLTCLDEWTDEGEAILAGAQNDTANKNALRHATDRAQDAGIFGAPSFTTEDGELFWGDDRLDAALDWACRSRASS